MFLTKVPNYGVDVQFSLWCVNLHFRVNVVTHCNVVTRCRSPTLCWTRRWSIAATSRTSKWTRTSKQRHKTMSRSTWRDSERFTRNRQTRREICALCCTRAAGAMERGGTDSSRVYTPSVHACTMDEHTGEGASGHWDHLVDRRDRNTWLVLVCSGLAVQLMSSRWQQWHLSSKESVFCQIGQFVWLTSRDVLMLRSLRRACCGSPIAICLFTRFSWHDTINFIRLILVFCTKMFFDRAAPYAGSVSGPVLPCCVCELML